MGKTQYGKHSKTTLKLEEVEIADGETMESPFAPPKPSKGIGTRVTECAPKATDQDAE